MSDEEQTRDEIEVANEEFAGISQVHSSPVQGEYKPAVKAKAKAKAKVKIIKEPVGALVEESVIEEQLGIQEEKPKTNDKLQEVVQCPDCKLHMT